MKIRVKIFLLLLLTIAVLVLVLDGVFYCSQKKVLSDLAGSRLQAIAKLQRDRLNSIIEQNLERLLLVSSRTQMRISLARFMRGEETEKNRQKIERILKDAQSSISSFRHICLFSTDGEALVEVGSSSGAVDSCNCSHDLLERSLVSGSADTIFLDSQGRPHLRLAGPLVLDRELIGVIVIESEVDNLLASVANHAGLGRSGEVLLLRRGLANQAEFLFPTRFDPLAALKRQSPGALTTVSSRALDVLSNEVFQGLDYRGHEVMAVAGRLAAVDWVVLVKIDSDEAFSSLIRTGWIVAMASLVCLVFGLLLAEKLSRTITGPIFHLNKAVRNVADGRFGVEISNNAGDELGELVRSFNHMLTQMQQARYDRDQSERLCREVLDNLTVGVITVDSEMQVMTVNRQMRLWFPKVSDDRGDLPCYKYFGTGGHEPCSFCPALMSLEDGEAHEVETIFTFAGRKKLFRVVGAALRGREGEIRGAVVLYDDISRRRKLEEDNLKIHKLEATAGLAGGIAHDFNNILTAIVGFVELAGGLCQEEEARQCLNKAVSAAMQAQHLTQKFITFATGGSPIREDFYLRDLISECAGRVQVSGVSYEFDWPAENKLVNLDKGQMTHVIEGLFSNAAEAMPQGGVIRVGLEFLAASPDDGFLVKLPPGPGLRVTVADQGEGISGDNLERVFDPYYSTRKRVGQRGLGMGLTLARSVINRHGGVIGLESQPGLGTVVAFYLPLTGGEE